MAQADIELDSGYPCILDELVMASMEPQPERQRPATAEDIHDLRTLSMLKGNHSFVIRYQVGEESKALDALIDWVGRPNLDFNWSDAAVLSDQLGRHLAKELKAFVPSKKSSGDA